MKHEELVKRCVKLAERNVRDGQAPFAAIVTRGGEVVSEAVNDGKATFDPTAHGEIRAIQMAGTKLETTDLSDCELYTNCEPCPMCLAAIHWSGIKQVYYGLSIGQQAEFDEMPQELYEAFRTGEHSVKLHDYSGKVDGAAPFRLEERE
ncbi:nucleoside deaminase [Paenalkalicoccus suaedae]|uniref:Nucleoside deaminase n=1 Tax=Paenalkalicoccus suaedae TaxID=2592382 RepID=A0A859FIR2_9BACI|nr:nucleoside deaminase [Paenalkalicoccus suaedae]QKS72800.1 nucleoside deaminase [Paenalkalicoccus suaedae]